MEKATTILRRSIHVFLQKYHSFSCGAALFALPFSGILLLSQSFTPSSSRPLQTLSLRLHSLFEAAGFPATSQFFSLLNLKLSQTIFSFLFCLPFTLTFFVLAKAAVIQTMLRTTMRTTRVSSVPSSESLLRLYRFILPTYLFNSFIILSANAAVFSLMFLAFNILDILRLSSDNCILVLSAVSAVLYSIVLANSAVACSLATVISAMDNCRGCFSFLKACVFIQRKEATAITLALPASLGMAATEALFQYRIVKPCIKLGRFSVPAAGEALLIAYMYSILIVLDTIITCVLYESCRDSRHPPPELEPAQKGGDLQA